jgi:hypothetical protein
MTQDRQEDAMGSSAMTGGGGKGMNAEPSKKGDAAGKAALTEGRAPSKKAPSAEEGASKKLAPGQPKAK